ncbi:MAG: Tim44 domain-containing protein [Nitrospirae bacterium]|nr:Tim44 domain-containing protein [Nitrospirota bacterium]
MKKMFILILLAVFFSVCLEENSFARAGGGSRGSSSYGSRGSKTYAPPARQAQPQQQNQMQKQAQPQQNMQPAAPQPSPWGGFMRGMAGGLVGGMLASMLFSSLGMGSGFGSGGFGGGIGMIEIILIGLIIFVIYKMVKSKKEQPALATPQGYGQYSSPEPQQAYQYQGSSTATTQQDDLSAGLSYIRQFDSTFDENRFKETAGDMFFKVQAAWMQRDMASVSNILAPEISDQMRKDSAQLKADGRINRLENIAMRNVAITEAWQEEGKDFITVEFTANVLDYVTDESGKILEGSNKEPVRFVEYWTFMRKIGTTNWQLSAIQQD